MGKPIRRVTDPEEQQMETYRYWLSRPVGERLIAVSEFRGCIRFRCHFRKVLRKAEKARQHDSQ